MKTKLVSSYEWFIHAPFRYNGHQAYALGSLLSRIPEHSSFVEPFCGGSGIFFSKDKSSHTWLNDINHELIETYCVMRDSPLELFRFFDNPFPAKNYAYVRDRFIPRTSKDTAARWFYLNRTSVFKNMGKRWEMDSRINLDLEAIKSIVLECSKKLQGVKLTKLDFEEVIDSAQDESFLFMSPPYSFGSSDEKVKQYEYPFNNEDHLRLCETLKRNSKRLRFLLTYPENEKIRELYSWVQGGIETLVSDKRFVGDKTKIPEEEIKEESGGEEIMIKNYLI